MLKSLYQSFMATFILAILLCGIYPALVTGLGQTLFPAQANGSLVHSSDGKIIGSHWIGQNFTRPEYFHGRPSAAGTGYDAANSSGSNLGPTNQKFADALKANVELVLKDNPSLKKGEVPVDLVTSSGSGLDPHITPEGAFVQAERVAQARKLDPKAVKELIQSQIQGPQWGFLGEATVNVFELNRALDAQWSQK